MAKQFKPRSTRPEKGNKYYITKSAGGYSPCITGYPTDEWCNVMSNCVGYVLGRFHEAAEDPTFSILRSANAEDIYDLNSSLKRGQTPKVGAVICWGQGRLWNGSDGCGHVAFVEEVIDENTIVTTESAYGGKPFYTRTRCRGNGNWGAGGSYYFRGFVYNPALEDAVSDTKPAAPAPTVEEKIPESTKPTANTALATGDKVELRNTALYGASTSKTKANTLTGTYYVHSAAIINGRIRITTPKGNSVVTGWVDVAELTSTPQSAEIKVGDKVRIRSGAKTYYDGILARFVYKTTYEVLEIGCGVGADYIVVGPYKGCVVAAVKVSDLQKV